MNNLSISIFLLTSGFSSYVSAAEEPAVIKYIKQQGVTIAGTFETEAGVKGYAAKVQGRELSIYLTPDNQHALIGSLINAKGEDLGTAALQRLISAPQNNLAWQQLEQADWVADGKADAPRIIYTFTDPNCPFCHRLRQAAAPFIDKGQVQLRHVMVGILRQDSLAKAANILGAKDPAMALQQHIQRYEQGGSKIDNAAVAKGEAVILKNNVLMQQLGVAATPTSFYRDVNGDIQMIQGMPSATILAAMFGDL
ncbi:thiol:disulfide interchange protein DsbG [Rheinheimera pacifica]|uniref:Thiol:disulfide interchange protein n=1 Tax=Rheinheimera pacifica TaxID=173990 RepID=A0A1H6L668_9GAMM|nr:thiol:disulfide interchange protein DsbG [Rheinheimera pacifica]SEH79905.1 thiol:disulfide interchange protein DsbG [Rheinheimera pacifica]